MYKRVIKELCDLKKNESKFFSVENITESTEDPKLQKPVWKVTFHPPVESPYHVGKFQLIVNFPDEYPFKPPKGYFITRIYHYLVRFDESESSWRFCNHCLFEEHDWSPARKLKQIFETTFWKFFTDLSYCIDGPQNSSLRDLCKENKDAYIKNAQEETLKYASEL